ncbi:MAG: SDR family oxidoreductase [Candidatus Caenarcaniphilales bacterium]|jgi:uncharacterized protein YbjT (DUF2867 family)|nr:SDR family oxidoreductase [Candidatus Caenarcaniphilales bacterium]
MKVLVLGANGYIGQRLILALIESNHEVIALVRDSSRFDISRFNAKVDVIEADLLNANSLSEIPHDVDIAFYLVHSMSTPTRKGFPDLEASCAENFVAISKQLKITQLIYLSGIVNSEKLSKHLMSRKNVEGILQKGNYHLTVLRAAIIIGSGSASFEIIRDLVEKLPVMITPKWLETKCQPIAIKNVIEYLTGVILQEKAYNGIFDIGGADILTYREMLLGYAKVRNLKRYIFTTPMINPNISSLWLSIITSTNYALARGLVTSLKNEVIVKRKGIEEIVKIQVYGYEESLKRTLYKISCNEVISSWTDAFIYLEKDKFCRIEVPKYGCQFDKRQVTFDASSIDTVKNNIWSIGGDRGWYYMNWAWKIRGFLDTVFGGVGLRRGRREGLHLRAGDALDFWRVIEADEEKLHLLLYAEMKLPGEAWLEFKINRNDNQVCTLIQTATFRPHGLWGRLYWYMLLPVHFFLFGGMANKIVSYK